MKEKKPFWLAVPRNWELAPGCGRSVDPVFSEEILDRRLCWSTSDEEIASVDRWGRVTAKAEGKVEITAVSLAHPSITASCLLAVRSEPTRLSHSVVGRRDYGGTPVEESNVPQKIVERWSWTHAKDQIPKEVWEELEVRTGGNQKAVTADGAVWSITEYGIRRDSPGERLERDRVMRLMGNRYLYDIDGPVTAILPDGKNGIWAATDHGITHIQVERMSAEKKAELLSENTQRYTCRRGAVTESRYIDGRWIALENDNDGLWTSMYAVGELFHYAVLRDEGVKGEKLKSVKEAALRSTEAVLLLANISCRTGTKEASIHYQTNQSGGKGYTKLSLVKEGNGSLPIPGKNPADRATIGAKPPSYPKSWGNLREEDGLEKRTRWLAGFPARNYILKGLTSECPDTYDFHDGIYYSIQPGGQAVSKTGKHLEDTLINGEYNVGLQVDASADIPLRLFHLVSGTTNPKTGRPFGKEDIIYKGDTSLDEIIGHLFLYKVAYDVLGPEDPELKEIIVSTVRNLAQHFSDNGYMLIDASGQPCTWGKASREYFYSDHGALNAPLAAAVLLCVFKTAAYITGEQKWEDEYHLAALEEPYQYAAIMTQYWERCSEYIHSYVETSTGMVGEKLKSQDVFYEILLLSNLNYSDEEMAMMCFYLLFQMESSEKLLGQYRTALDAWWNSIQYSENPLWYFMYQLLCQGQEWRDAYGNKMLDTAAWALGRHPIDLRRWCATNSRRDDVESVSVAQFGWGGEKRYELCYKKEAGSTPVEAFSNARDPAHEEELISYLKRVKASFAVAAPDERSFHKFNRPTYVLKGADQEYYQPMMMEASTTYTLPYWLGRYHRLLRKGRENL